MPAAGLVARSVFVLKLLPALVALAALLAVAGPLQAQEALRGVALVIGNGDYEHLAPLPNPPDDADAIEELLSDLGFDSVRRTDRDADDLARDLERFVEDAAGADVAILYYAGHGIEAGGENWLVPVDADISALDEAATKLVPVSQIIGRLRETVPVTIVLLDACRDNPFPPGATLKLAADAAPLPVSAGGLSEPGRGASPTLRIFDSSVDKTENLGIVVGFAAAPGQVALDGAAGENSPYAAAFVRHIAAMAGEEFGTVMRMVAEEVYLKTDGRQRPWVNESLRRLLYFGDAPQPVSGPEGDILTERRQLLLTISALPDLNRRQVERVAGQGGVAMDAVYGMLKVLGQDAPDDPLELEKLLQKQTEELKTFLAARRVVENPDPELARLSALSDRAVAEGAIETARRLRAEVEKRIGELSSVIEREEDLIRARRTEFAAEFARSAEINRLAFDYAAAAADYEQAHDQIERWDARLAWEYRKKQIDELLSHNRLRGDPRSLERAAELAESLVATAGALGQGELGESRVVVATVRFTTAHADRDTGGYLEALEEVDAALAILPSGIGRAAALNRRGLFLGNIASSLQQAERYEEAIASYRQALAEFAREEDPRLWMDVQTDLGNLLAQVAMSRIDPEPLREAIELFEEAKDVVGSDDPVDRMFLQMQLALFRIALPQMQNPAGITPLMADALIAEIEISRAEIDPAQFPLVMGLLDQSVGLMYAAKSSLDNNIVTLQQAAAAFRSALTYRRRDTAPGEWAESSEQLAFVLRRQASMAEDPAIYRDAIAAFEDALTVFTPAGALQRWAPLSAGLVRASRELGSLEDDRPALEQSAGIAWAALAEPALAKAPDLRFRLREELSLTLDELYYLDGDFSHLREGMAVLEAALVDIDPAENPGDYAATLYGIGDAAYTIGMAEAGTANLRRSVETYEQALALHDRADRYDFGITSYNIAKTLITIANREGSADPLHRALPLLADAAEYIDRRQHALDYAHAVADRGTALLMLLQVEKDLSVFDEIGSAYDEAIGIYESRDRAALALAWRNVGLLHLQHDRLTNSLDHHDEAIAAFRTAVEKNIAIGGRAELFRSAFSLGAALSDLARQNNDDRFVEEAAEAYRQALTVPPTDVPPVHWANAQHDLGLALRRLGVSRNDTASLAEAETAFRAALEIRTPQADIAGWFYSQNALADTLTELAVRGEGTDHLGKALAAYEAMMQRYPPDWSVMGRAELRLKRGNMLRMIGDRGGGAESFRAASASYREALEIAGGENAPEFQLGVRRNLGETLRFLASATGDMDEYRRSADAYRTALAHIPETDDGYMRALVQRDIGLSLASLGDAGGDDAALEEAVASLSAAALHFDRENYPESWGYIANHIAWLDIVAGRRGGEVGRFEKAAGSLREIAAVQREIGDRFNLGFTEDSLCAALFELGVARGEKPLLAEAGQACERAVALLREHGQDGVATNTEKLLARVVAAGATLKP
jgi:uncharacterized caspase-like protein